MRKGVKQRQNKWKKKQKEEKGLKIKSLHRSHKYIFLKINTKDCHKNTNSFPTDLLIFSTMRTKT